MDQVNEERQVCLKLETARRIIPAQEAQAK